MSWLLVLESRLKIVCRALSDTIHQDSTANRFTLDLSSLDGTGRLFSLLPLLLLLLLALAFFPLGDVVGV